MKNWTYAAGFFICISLSLGGGCTKPVGKYPVSPSLSTPTPTPTVPSCPIACTSTFTSTRTVAFLPTWTATITPTGIWNTPTSTATPYQTPYSYPPYSGIFFWGTVHTIGDDGTIAGCTLSLSVNNTFADTAAVTLTTPFGDIPLLHYQGDSTYSTYMAETSFPYLPGETYILTAMTSVGTVTASLVAPGGGVSLSTDRSTLTWDYEGNRDFYWLFCSAPPGSLHETGHWTGDIASPASIPSSAYPFAGVYTLKMYPQNTLFTVPGANNYSQFTIRQRVIIDFTYPP
jgi:hypothetical protein